MSEVSITRSKLDYLANCVSSKSGESVPLTIDEMADAVLGIQTGGTLITKSITQNGIYDAEDDNADGYSSVNVSVSAPAPTLQSKTYTVDSAGTETITADSGYDGLSSVAVSVPSANPYIYIANPHFFTEDGSRKWNITPTTVVDVGEGDAEGWLADGFSQSGNVYEVNAMPSNTSVTPTESSQTIGGANYMMEGAVTVQAIPSNYVGSGITRRYGTDITSAGNAVSIPEGYYDDDWTHRIADGTAGTPTATKGTVSNHSVSVTPSVTNTSGYITGSTKTGTAVTVSASELVSGTYTVSASGTHDVTNYASASVASGSATASATKGTVSNHSVTVTPSVTRTAGYITAGSANGTAVTVSASELVSGSETKTANGTYDVTNLASLVVNIPFVTYYTGTSTPASSLGSNGDIYLKTV